jgi:hypothetical protein
VSTTSRELFLLRAGKSSCGVVAAALLFVTLSASAWAQEESLGDYARRVQTQKQSQVQISTEDGVRLFKEVDTITQFSSQDSGLPKLAPVKRKLIGRAEAEKHFRNEGEDETQRQRRLDQTTVVLQKFGMLPANFEINTALHDIVLNGIAGFYDFNDRTMYLLNWIDPDVQRFPLRGAPCWRDRRRWWEWTTKSNPWESTSPTRPMLAGLRKTFCRPPTIRRSRFTTLHACCARPWPFPTARACSSSWSCWRTADARRLSARLSNARR